VIDKAIVINVKMHKNESKRFYSSKKEGLICGDKRIMANFKVCIDEIPGESYWYIPNLKIYKQMLPVPNWLLDWFIFSRQNE
jgi:hypothetical protein